MTNQKNCQHNSKLSLTENELSFHPENDKCEVVFPLDNVSISETDKVINLTAGLRFFSNEANSANRIDEYKEVLKSRNAHLRKTCKKLSMKKNSSGGPIVDKMYYFPRSKILLCSTANDHILSIWLHVFDFIERSKLRHVNTAPPSLEDIQHRWGRTKFDFTKYIAADAKKVLAVQHPLFRLSTPSELSKNNETAIYTKVEESSNLTAKLSKNTNVKSPGRSKRALQNGEIRYNCSCLTTFDAILKVDTPNELDNFFRSKILPTRINDLYNRWKNIGELSSVENASRNFSPFLGKKAKLSQIYSYWFDFVLFNYKLFSCS
ncbi:uncharacterized protein LOC142337995 [Convolutriloba macropyga]|uniref:uncharacterized protein LOC142337995 n=1 Tax=Convolutriloba macropyga TaxID=536237 RepID=UPI003F51F546